MLKKRLAFVMALALAVAALLPVVNSVRADGDKVLTLSSGAGDIPTLDPALAEDSSSIQIINSIFYPLIRDMEDKPGNIQPGIAEKWAISEDGTTYTFTLRNNISWVKWDAEAGAVVQVMDGDKPVMVTANDFEYGIKRMLDPRTASPYAYVFVDSLGIVGAAALNGFKVPDGKQLTDPDIATELDKLAEGVAVKALDPLTLEVKIGAKLSFAESIFQLWSLSAVPAAAIAEHGDKWTEPGNAFNYGPFVVSEWRNDESMTLVKNPFWPGIENSPVPNIDKIVLLMLDETPSFNNYEAGTMDVVGVPSSEIDRVKADPVLSQELKIAPLSCTYTFQFNVTKEPFTDARVRRAFSMAIDREDIVNNVTKGGQEPAYWFSRPGLIAAPTMEDSPELGVRFDAAKAKAELDAYLAEKGMTVDQLPPITVMVNQVEGHIRIAEAMQQMWKDTLGVTVEIATQEWKVFLETRKTDAPQIFRFAWCKDYPDASNFAKDVFRSNSSQNDGKYNNPEYDKLVDQAALETDLAKRLELYRQAETLLNVNDAGIIPIYWYTRVVLTKPYVTRTFAAGAGDERWEKWSINK
jgi:oligopeptide transport system substrate-binding protein